MSHVSAQVIPQSHGRRHLSDRRISMFFIMPTLVLLILMNVFPLFYSLYLSFTDYSVIANEPPKWIALENFEKILTTERTRYWHNFTVTGKYAML
jgi:multiple sugar transport system permease protein